MNCPAIGRRLQQASLWRAVQRGDVLYRDGGNCDFLPLMIDGELVVSKSGEIGRSITLYRVAMGESCILSALSILNHAEFPAEAIGDTAATVLLVPATLVRDLVGSDPAWRDYVFSLYHGRITSLINLPEEVTFRKLDVRLVASLLAVKTPEGVVSKTHQTLAAELGSSREVISRLLKEWESQRLLELHRGRIQIRERERLENIAANGD